MTACGRVTRRNRSLSTSTVSTWKGRVPIAGFRKPNECRSQEKSVRDTQRNTYSQNLLLILTPTHQCRLLVEFRHRLLPLRRARAVVAARHREVTSVHRQARLRDRLRHSVSAGQKNWRSPSRAHTHLRRQRFRLTFSSSKFSQVRARWDDSSQSLPTVAVAL